LDRAEVGTERKDVGDQALIRGSTPHFRLFVWGCLCLGSGVDLEDRPHILPEVSPTVAPSPPLHEGCQLASSLSCTVLLLCGEFHLSRSWSLTAYRRLYWEVPSFCSIGTILPSRPARETCRRAQWQSRMARLRATASAARSVLDGREHAGMIEYVGAPIRPRKTNHQKASTKAIKKRVAAHLGSSQRDG